MVEPRFKIYFHPKALKEYEDIDHSVAVLIDKKLEDIENRADEIGIILRGNLVGFREIKLRDAGIRIIYQITDEKVDILKIVYILTINKRESERVFQIASERIQQNSEFDMKGRSLSKRDRIT